MFQLHLAVGRDGSLDNPVLSRLTLVDLAGSERTSQTGGTGRCQRLASIPTTRNRHASLLRLLQRFFTSGALPARIQATR
jgi:hypothetical protein